MSQVFVHKRHRVVAGLKWIPLPGNENTNPRQELKDGAASYGVDSATHGLVFRTQDGRSHGAVVPNGAPASANDAYSGAAWLAQLVQEPTLLVQRLAHRDNRWWVVAVRPGAVDPATDSVLPEGQAVEKINRVLFDATQDREFFRVLVGDDAPESPYLDALPWEEDLDTSAALQSRRKRSTFQEFVADESPARDVRVRQIAGIPRWMIFAIILVALAVAAAIGATLWIRKEKAARELEDLQRELAESQLLQQQIVDLRGVRISQAVGKALSEDTSTPPPMRVLQGCLDAYSKVSEMVAGWAVAKVECATSNPNARVTLQRDPMSLSTNAGLAAWVEDRGWSVSVDPAGTQATMSLPAAWGDPRQARKPAQLPSSEGFVLRDGSYLQRLQAMTVGTQVQITAPSARAITYLDPEKENAEAVNERYQPVPAELGYQTGRIMITGRGVWTMPRLPLDAPHYSIGSVVIQPEPLGQGDKFNVEATYVVGNL